jgi:hypothetical protein
MGDEGKAVGIPSPGGFAVCVLREVRIWQPRRDPSRLILAEQLRCRAATG